MAQYDILCYKLCFCFGVPDETLARTFPHVHRVATQLNYFADKPATLTYRAIYKVFYMLVRHFDMFETSTSLTEVIGKKCEPCISDVNIDFEALYKECGSVPDMLSVMCKLANNQLPAVYTELQLGLGFNEFMLLTLLKPLSEEEVYAVQFLLRRLPAAFTIYFSQNEVLNVAVTDMMKSGVSLLRRLRVLNMDKPVEMSADSSILQDYLDSDRERIYRHRESLLHYKKIIVDGQSVSSVTVDRARVFLGGSVLIDVCPDTNSAIERCKELSGEGHGEGYVLLTKCQEQCILQIRDILPKLDIYLVMPIEHNYYKKMRECIYPHVYLFSLGDSTK